MKRGAFWSGLGLLLVVSLLVPACGQAPKQEGVELRVAMSGFGNEALDPINANGDNMSILAAMFDHPFELDNNGIVAPGIVKSWEIDPGGLSWTFHLRDDVMFHDGVNADGTKEPSRKLKAEDVAFSYERAVADTAYRISEWKAALGDKPKTQVVDDVTVRIFTKAPTSYLAIDSSNNMLIWVVPKAYIEKNGVAYFKSHPIGTGAYRFASFATGDSIVLQAVDYKPWTGTVPDFKKVTFYLVPDEATRVNMMTKGTADVILASMDNAVALKDKGFSMVRGLQSANEMRIVGAYLPQAKGMPLADIRVRQALSLAINRQELNDTLFHGLGTMPAHVALIGLGSPDVPVALRDKWNAWAKANYVYDIKKAKQLVSEACPSGCSFDIWQVPDKSAPWVNDMIAALAGYWQAAGLRVNIVPMDEAAYKDVRNTKKSDKMIGKMVLAGTSDINPNSILQMANFGTSGKMAMLDGSPSEAEMNTLWKEGSGYTTPARLQEILDKMLDVAANSWTNTPVITVPLMYVLGPRVNANVPPIFENWGSRIRDWKFTGFQSPAK